VLGGILCGGGAPARGDVWTYEHNGVVYFTNYPPSSAQAGAEAHRWQVAFKSGPGKASTVSGAVAGCAKSRADVVPARDISPDRLHRYDRHISEAATVYGLPVALIRAVIQVESDYDPRVVSCAGARGLMQLMPDVEKEQQVADVFDPRRNILGGSRLLRLLANRFRGDLVLTIAGYHAGAGAVLKYDGVPPYETTQRYVRMVLKAYQGQAAAQSPTGLGLGTRPAAGGGR
jgi:soluble lytic murein transglycosylase-like protein